MATMFQAVAKMFHGIAIQFKSQDLAISREALDEPRLAPDHHPLPLPLFPNLDVVPVDAPVAVPGRVLFAST